jgi:Tfp pilus assembly protein FimV
MTRHFLALLALLTGLAAFGSPAQASLAEALACGSTIAAAAGDEAAGEQSVAVQPVPSTLHESREVEAPESRPAAPAMLRLPVLMGVERAFE